MIIPGRPHGKGPANFECGVRRGDPVVVVEPLIASRRERRRAVVDVQQYNVEAIDVCSQGVAHVLHLDSNAAVFEGAIGQRGQWPAVPFDDFRYQLCYRHARLRWQQIQRGP